MSNTEAFLEIAEAIRKRQKYSSRVYLFTSALLVISFLQWTLFKFLPSFNVYFKSHFALPLLLLFGAIILIALFVFFEDLRFHFPANWIIVLVIVEFATLGLTSAIVYTSFPLFGSSILIVVVLFIIFSTVGMYMQRDLTDEIAVLFACTILFFIATIMFLIMAVLAEMSFSVLFYGIGIECTALMFLLYHTQIIHGARYAEMRFKDHLLPPLLLYNDFLVLYLITLFLLKTVLEEESNIYAFRDLFPRNTTLSAIAEGSPYIDYEYGGKS